MALDVGRWLKYAQAKLGRAVQDANAEMDDLEAQQQARAADRPWIAADGEAPTLDEAKARIEWEAEQQRQLAEEAERAERAKAAPPAEARASADPAPSAASADAPTAPPPEANAEDPDLARARLELDRQAREGRERLAAIRKELGVEPPEGPPAS